MTIPNNNQKDSYNGNGVTTVFNYNYKIFKSSEVQVTLTSIAGIDSILTLTTHYSVTGVGDSSGIITMVTAPLTGEKLTLKRLLIEDQQTDLRNQGGFFPEVIEDEFDRSRAIDLQQREEINRSLKFSVGTKVTDFNFPEGVSPALKIPRYKSDGTGLELVNAVDAGFQTIITPVLKQGSPIYGVNAATFGQVDDVKYCGAYTDFETAVSTIGVTVSTLVVTEVEVVANNVTVPSTLSVVVVSPGSVSVNATKTVTFNGPFQSYSGTCFPGDGTVVLGRFVDQANVMWFGATGDGTTDDTAAIQAAVTAALSVYIPAGNYIVDGVVSLRTGNHVFGAGFNATRLVRNGTGNASQGVFNANSGGASVFIDDLHIHDLKIDGLVGTRAFSEHLHLITFHGVRDSTIENVHLVGFRGDGVYVGSGIVGGDERHNHNIKILNNIFDGVNNDNRNGVSIIDVDGLLVAGNTFTNVTRSNMPGAVDIEPNSNIFAVAKNITVENNHFDNILGNVAAIAVVLTAATFTTQPENFIIRGNTFDTTLIGISFSNSAVTYARPFNIVISGNSGKTSRPFNFGTYINGVSITGNTFRMTQAILFGFSATDKAINFIVIGNLFSGDFVTQGLVIRSGNNIVLSNNIFNDFADYSVKIGTAGSTLSEVMISNNSVNGAVGFEFANDAGITNISVLDNDLSQATIAMEGSFPADIRIRGNKNYISENGSVTAAITTGATVAHGLTITPSIINVTPKDLGTSAITVSAVGATTFVINFVGGGSHIFSWEAKILSYYNQ